MDSAANAAEKVKMTAKGIVEDAMEGASDAKDAVTEIAADLKEQLLEKATKLKDDIDRKLGTTSEFLGEKVDEVKEATERAVRHGEAADSAGTLYNEVPDENVTKENLAAVTDVHSKTQSDAETRKKEKSELWIIWV